MVAEVDLRTSLVVDHTTSVASLVAEITLVVAAAAAAAAAFGMAPPASVAVHLSARFLWLST